MIDAYHESHALEAALRGTPAVREANHLAIQRKCAVALVLAAPGREVEAAAMLVADPDFSPRFSAPGEWLVVSEAHTGEALETALRALAGDFAYVLDQSHGRVAMTLSGPDSARILANGIGMDLHRDVFTVGRAANVLCGHTGVNLARTGEDAFDLIVMRSFAESLVEQLRIMARCFPFSVDFSA